MEIWKLLEVSPYIELAVRQVYWRNRKLIDKRRRARPAKAELAATSRLADILDLLRGWGVGRGDLLVVHSGFEGLKPAGAKPDEIIDALLDLVGPEGTLAMSTIPFFRKEPRGADYMTRDVSDLVPRFDPARTPASTGEIAYLFMGRPGVVRSRHPINTMAALGPHAAAMMAGNLDGELPLPCGPTSSWKYCVDHGAKVIALGVDLVHTLTIIHTAEDCCRDRWPQGGWYRQRRYNLVDGADSREIAVRERHPRWAMHYAERTLHRDLLREGLARHSEPAGVPVALVAARPLYDYLVSRNASGYPYYLLPDRSVMARSLLGRAPGRPGQGG